jgi:RNA polymerase-interacting CarD/CdnL/TRCF family regulator
MFVKAKKILASELMYAKQMDEEQTHVWLDDVLSGTGTNGKRRAKAKVGASA